MTICCSVATVRCLGIAQWCSLPRSALDGVKVKVLSEGFWGRVYFSSHDCWQILSSESEMPPLLIGSYFEQLAASR